MKRIILLFVLLAIVSCGGFKEKGKESVRALHDDRVYVCTGRYAKRFHCDEDCKGLRSCRSEIVLMSVKEAEDCGLTPCGYCY